MSFLGKIYYRIKRKVQLYLKINWIKSLYLNLKFFPLKDAFKFPIIVFGSLKIESLKGKLIVNVPLKTGIISIGNPFEIFKKSSNISELIFDGMWVVNGSIIFGIDTKLYIGKEAYFENGHLCSVCNNSKIFCDNKIIMGDSVKIGDESIVFDTNFHDLFDVKKNETIPCKGEVYFESYIYIGMRCTIKLGTYLPSYSMVATNSLCNKNYSAYGNNILLGGIPANFIRGDIKRNWSAEENLENYLTIKL